MRKTGTTTRGVKTAALVIAAMGIAGAAPAAWSPQESNAPASSAQVASPSQSAKAWSSEFWEAASEGDRTALIALLHRAQGDLADVALAETATALGVALDENTIARSEQVAEHRETIETTLSTIAEGGTETEREEALMEGMSAAIALHMLADDKEAVLEEASVLQLVSETDRSIRRRAATNPSDSASASGCRSSRCMHPSATISSAASGWSRVVRNRCRPTTRPAIP